jgi:hypothetical protein
MSLAMTKTPQQASRAIPGVGIARAPPQFLDRAGASPIPRL